MEQILEELGLTQNEAKIYLCLVNKGQLSAGRITQFTAIHRRNVYDSLDRLIQKGIVGYIKENNLKLYTAANPKQLLKILFLIQSLYRLQIPLELPTF